jgi:hypothetical protein
MRRFYELRRYWPEGNASVKIVKNPESKVHYLDVYEHPCNEAYLLNFQILPSGGGTLLDSLPNNNGWPIVSPRCRKVFEGVNADIKAFIASIRGAVSSGCPEGIKEYSLISTNLVLDCLDLDNSELTWFSETREQVQKHYKLRFFQEKIPARISYFCVGRMASAVIVSGELRDDLMHANITGLYFRECDVV